MSIEQLNFDLLVDQRHFYFIALRDTAGYTLTDYWNQIGNVVTPGQQRSDHIYPDFEIQHRRFRSYFPYPRGKLLEIVSASGDGTAPYLYDVFALRMMIEAKTYFVFAFPFAALARDVIDDLINNHDLRRKGDILKVEVPVLVQHSEVEVETAHIRMRIVGLQVVIADDPALSSLSLGGDNPLKSSIYQDFLKEPIRKSNFIPDRCVLACELQWPLEMMDQEVMSQRKVRSRMHMDAFGNFKFYVHVSGANFVIVPYLLQRLNSLKCLDKVSINPLQRMQQEDEL